MESFAGFRASQCRQVNENINVTDRTIEMIVKSGVCATLTELDLSWGYFTTDDVVMLLDACPRLTKFSWHYWDLDDEAEEKDWENTYARVELCMKKKGGCFEGYLQ